MADPSPGWVDPGDPGDSVAEPGIGSILLNPHPWELTTREIAALKKELREQLARRIPLGFR